MSSDILSVLQREVGSCREWKGDNRCGTPSEYVLWGKLLDPEALGPRGLGDPGWAIIDLKRLARALDLDS